jgi:hypothetical protein
MDGDNVLSNWDFVQWPFKRNHYWVSFKNVSNLPIITYKQFLEMQTKQIIGYKFKEECSQYAQAALKICQPNDVESFKLFVKDGYLINLTFNASVKPKLEEAGVLDLWFEPVFQTEEKILELGSPKKSIRITKEGFTVENNLVKESVISQLLYDMRNTDKYISIWNVEYLSVKIGCSTFTKEELELLIKTQKEL